MSDRIRLSARDWTEAGLAALEEGGFPAVRADTLARRLGVSRGSFYWHFADIAAFESALVAHWRDLVLAALDQPAGHEPATVRLATLLRRSMLSQRRVERAFRAWGTVNARIADALTAVDRNRLAYLERLLAEAGLHAEQAALRAKIAYWTYLGHAAGARAEDETIEAVVAMLIADLNRDLARGA